MLLADPERVLQLMGASVKGDSTETAEAALHVASEAISVALDTPLEHAARQDYFSYLPSVYDKDYDPVTLILQQAFLVSPPNIYLSTDGSTPNTGALTPLTINVHYTVDLEKGTIRLLSTPLSGYGLILVEYVAGFTGSDDTTIPTWLIQAAMKEGISQIQSSVIGYNRKDMRDKSGFLDRAARRLLDAHYRPRVGVFPDSSTVVTA